MAAREPHRAGQAGHSATHRAIIALGSNIDADRNIPLAIDRIARQLKLLAATPPEKTSPIGPTGQDAQPGTPDFLNAAVLVETTLDQKTLAGLLRRLESYLGRTRTADRYAPRTIDLDIVVWDGRVIDPDVRQRPYLRRQVSLLWPDALKS